MKIDRRFKGCNDQQVHEVALEDVGTPSPTSTYFEGAEPLYLYRENQAIALVPSAQAATEIRAIQPHASG